MEAPKLPTTLNEAIEYIYPRFEGMDKYFKTSEDDFAAFCHSQLSGGIGMQIRNSLGLWNNSSELSTHMQHVQLCHHPDSMSDLILRGVYKKWHVEHPETALSKESPLSEILTNVSPKSYRQ